MSPASGARDRPGRKLPATTANFTREGLSEETTELLLALVILVRRVGGFKQLAMAAHQSEADLPRPRWATGDPGDDDHARACSKLLSKALGKGARKAPDWATVAWVLHLCVSDDQRAATTGHITDLWQKATGTTAPNPADNDVATTRPYGDNPCSAGDNDNRESDNSDDNARLPGDNNVASDNDDAPLVAVIAVRDRQIQDLLDQVKMMGEANEELRERLLRAELDRRQERNDNQRTQQALNAALDKLKADHAIAVKTHGAQLQLAIDNGNRRTRALTAQLETARHNAAVLAAHIRTNRAQGSEIDLETLLPISPPAGRDLRMDHQLRTMLNPAPKVTAPHDDNAAYYNLDVHVPNRTIMTWLRVYVGSMLAQAHPEGLFTAFSAEQAGQLTAFVKGGPLPSNDTLRAVIKVHPTLGTYLPALVTAANQPGVPGRAVLIPVPVDLFTPTAPVRPRTRHSTVPDSPRTQISVSDLYARSDVHKKMSARGDKPSDNTSDIVDNARTHGD